MGGDFSSYTIDVIILFFLKVMFSIGRVWETTQGKENGEVMFLRKNMRERK